MEALAEQKESNEQVESNGSAYTEPSLLVADRPQTPVNPGAGGLGAVRQAIIFLDCGIAGAFPIRIRHQPKLLQGKLKFDDTLGELLDIDFHQVDKDVTVRQLLVHTSGVPDYFDETVMSEYEDLWIDYPNYKSAFYMIVDYLRNYADMELLILSGVIAWR